MTASYDARATAYSNKRQSRNYHCERYESTGKKLCANGNVEGTDVHSEYKTDCS